MKTALLALLAVSLWAAGSDYQESHSFRDKADGASYAVVFLKPTEGHHGGRLDIYASGAGGKTLVYTHPGALAFPELDADQPPRRFSSIFKDGSHTLVYRMTNELSPTSKLYIVRLKDGRFKRYGPFSEGRLRDVNADGKPEVIVRKPPEGSTMIRCEEFHADAGSARQTEILAWDGTRFADVSAKYPEFFEQRLPQDRQALAELEPQRLKLSGAFAGAALTLYYDEKAAGHPKEAWQHLNALIDANASHPAVLAWSHGKECVAKLRSEARERLHIPADW